MSNQERCSYKCLHYRDGAVASICNNYRTILRYDGAIPPLKCEQCIKDRRPAMSETKPKKGE